MQLKHIPFGICFSAVMGQFLRGTELFVRMSAIWRSQVPREIANEEPSILIKLLELGDTRDGIPQIELLEELRLKQSYLSKLIKKLVHLDFVSIRSSSADRRYRFVRTTERALSLLRNIEEAMTMLQPPEPEDPFVVALNQTAASVERGR